LQLISGLLAHSAKIQFSTKPQKLLLAWLAAISCQVTHVQGLYHNKNPQEETGDNPA
jgi:hypothetical protein